MISIYCLINDTEWSTHLFNNLLERLPQKDQLSINKYLRWQDRQATLSGRLLLNQALIDLDSNLNLYDISFNKYNKPYFLNQPLFFNITHSGKYVLCSVSKELCVGIDVEERKDINVAEYKSVFTDNEWSIINQDHEFDINQFYKYWSRKESLIKANGKGLNIPLNSIDVTQNKIYLDGEIWFLKNIELDINYACCLAISKQNDDHVIKNIDIESLH